MGNSESMDETISLGRGQTEKKARRNIEDELKILREAGIEIVGEAESPSDFNGDSTDFGGMTIIGTQGPSRKKKGKSKS